MSLIFNNKVVLCSFKVLYHPLCHIWASHVAQSVKNLPAMQETWVRFLGWATPLKKKVVTHSSILSWRIPWTEEPGRLQFVALQESDTTQRLNTIASHIYFWFSNSFVCELTTHKEGNSGQCLPRFPAGSHDAHAEHNHRTLLCGVCKHMTSRLKWISTVSANTVKLPIRARQYFRCWKYSRE